MIRREGAIPQLRQNIITGEWVVIAPERAERPSDFVIPATRNVKPVENCPFCLGSPAHQLRYKECDTPLTYTIPNKFPAFVSEGQHEVRSYYAEDGFYRAKPATGGHEIIVINNHDDRLPAFSHETMVDMLETFKGRYQYYRDQPQVEYVMAIYNHGQAAGASIEHPHAQLFASSIVPNHILKEKHGSERYYEINGRCVFCEMIDHERREQVRFLGENDDYVMFTFFAARFPFEIWVLPKDHHSTYEEIPTDQIQSLSHLFRQALQLLDKTLKDPSVNFFIHSLPTTSEKADYYHWHIEIAPRVATYGGFEMGGSTVIDVVSPEQAAEFLRAENTLSH